MMVFGKRQNLLERRGLPCLVGVPIVLGMLIFALPGQVLAQMPPQGNETQALLDRINRLERDIRTLNLQLAGRVLNQPPVANAPQNGTVPLAAPSSSASAVPTPASKIEFTNGEGVVSRVMVRVQALEEEVRNATGASETMTHNIDQLTARLDKFMVDLDFRLRRLEGTMPGATSAVTPGNPVNAAGSMMPQTPPISAAPSPGAVSKVGAMPPVPTQAGVLGMMPKADLDQIVNANKDGQAPRQGATGDVGTSGVVQDTAVSPVGSVPDSRDAAQQVTPPSTPAPAVQVPQISAKDQYKAAFNLTRQARYKEAEIAFKTFLQTYGDDKMAGNANYWLGETYYVRKNYMQAAQVFFQAYQKFPQGTKAEDSLLKLGMSMAGLEKITEACATYGKLRKEFGADMKPNIERALNKETKRLKCK